MSPQTTKIGILVRDLLFFFILDAIMAYKVSLLALLQEALRAAPNVMTPTVKIFDFFFFLVFIFRVA